MQYEMPVYADGIGKAKQTSFRGLNHNPGAGDGQIYEMKNLCSDYYPLMATRPRRANTGQEFEDVPDALFVDDAVYATVNGYLYRDGVQICEAGSTEDNRIAKLNDYLIMMPGKRYYNEESGEAGSLEGELSIQEGAQGRNCVESYARPTITPSTANFWATINFQCSYIEIYIEGDPEPPTYESYPIMRGELTEGMVMWLRYAGTVYWKGVIQNIETNTGPSTQEPDTSELYYTVTVYVEAGNADAAPSGANANELFVYDPAIAVTYKDGKLYGVSAEANTIYCRAVNWEDYFRVGDAVNISGSGLMADTTLIIREINGHELRFYENSFPFVGDSGEAVETSTTWKIKRVVPDMDGIFESGNRLWGWKGKTIYASKLGDPFNWNVFDGLETDSWAVEIGGVGDITGGIEYQGYPTFFREWDLFKVFGSVPSNFEIIRTAETGVKAGSGKSLAVAGETLFYHNRNGIYAYAGGLPGKISGAFGTVEYEDCVAGSDGQKYYCSMRERGKPAEELDSWHLFVYDTSGGAWHEEDSVRATGFGRYGERFLMSGELAGVYGGEEVEHGVFSIGRTYYETENLEDPVDWWAEFTDFTDDSPNKKGISKLQIRLEMDEGTEDDPSWVEVKLMCDSDGVWITPEGGRIEEPEKRSYILPIIPRRADHYRLRLEGHGGCRIYSIAREYYQGSDLKSRPGRQ